MTLSAGQAQPGDVTVVNFALAHVGSSAAIQNLDTDASNEAIVCRTFYYASRDEVLCEFPWAFATKFAQLSQVGNIYPTSEWTYTYRYPADCLSIRRICSGIRNDSRQSRVSYKISADSQGLLILTDWQAQAQSTANPPSPMLIPDIEYTCRAYDPSQWPSDFIQALSFKLAYYIAPQLGKGDTFNIAPRMMQMYKDAMATAKARNWNEQQPDLEVESEFIRAREGLILNPYASQPYKNFPTGYPVS